MVLKGQQVYETKCARCHNMNDKTFNASGFAGITDRKSPAYVMNMVTGVPLNEFAPSNEISTLEKCWTREKANWLDIIEARDFVELLLSQKTQ
jgi:mono/diheme cytochrome c family protein